MDRCASGELPAQVAVVVSNNSGSGALERAHKAGIPSCHLSGATHRDPDALDRVIDDTLRSHGVDLVLLSGYMKKLGPVTLESYRNRVLNIHPALLPSFGGKGMYGLRVHQAVLDSGVRVTGVTVHLADRAYDEGPIVVQDTVRVRQDDTPETLAARVLEIEHSLYSEAVRLFAEGRITVDGRRVHIREEPRVS
jgi:phosphoribosylglycinamide formyltransferase-1